MSCPTAVITTQALGPQGLSSKVHSFPAAQTGSTTTNDSSQHAIFVGSVDGAEHHLLSYLGLAEPLHDLRLRIPESVFGSKPVENILRSALRQKRRFVYDRETFVLRVYAMARPVHDSVSRLVSDFIGKALVTGFITPEEQECISCGNTSVRLARSGFYASQNTKKLQAWTKYPDAVILFGDPDSTPLPSVVFEVGFTESYTDLVSDAAQWLEKSGGIVRLVVLVNIKEDVQSRKTRQRSKEAQRRIRELVTQFGNAKVKDREGIDYEGSDVESDAELYDKIQSAIVVEDWVGPISVTLEVWHIVDGTPKLRQAPITVLPKPLFPQNPIIYIKDIVPEESRASFEGFDESRITELDMDRYRRLLSTATRRLAHLRALDHIRPREKNDDGKYIA